MTESKSKLYRLNSKGEEGAGKKYSFSFDKNNNLIGINQATSNNRGRTTGSVPVDPSTDLFTNLSTSDAALKHNINPIENALQMLDSINGVSFNWNFNNAPSLGVLAQDVETVAPELVKNANNKSVNYNGLIGILVEAVKELSAEVKALKG